MNKPIRLRSLEMLSFEQIRKAIDEVGALGNEFTDWLEAADEAIKELKEASQSFPQDIAVIKKFDEMKQLTSPTFESIARGLGPFASKFR